MDAARWQRIQGVFHRVADCGPAERMAALLAACGSDADLREEVQRLLEADASADGFLEQRAIDSTGGEDVDDRRLPDRIGPYRVERSLGRGGMGAVYLAERDDAGFRQTVAIKVVRRGLDGDFILRRFETERQILAALEHPGIARLYDGGTTADGRPYFVMEYVRGQGLLAYCDSRGLAVGERLGLFRRICAAVQFAHQNLVVHRDLKPSNVIVTAEGEPKLLDFGLAKLLAPGSPDDSCTTMVTALRLMTPEYASPEQVRGERVTTASDVYSLGVILYELLTGYRPYRLERHSTAELERAVLEQDPPAPSTAVRGRETPSSTDGEAGPTRALRKVGAPRIVPPARLRRLLRGDLDNIVLKALSKDPARRYASAAELADDLGRYLEGLPVRARPLGRAYRAAKFVRRHRVGMAAATAAAISLLAGFGVAMWQARQARAERAVTQRRFDEARRLIRTVVFDVQPKLGAVSGTTPLRKTLIESTLLYLEALAGDAGDNPALLRELAGSYVELARIQGDMSTANVGEPRAARDSLRKAEDLVE